mmetsp:Transcript_45849/g.93836  ORF Transcript_45849/g.93836 Transcript_45849/m.93836 type:complete len:274 (+) Transcript_45849:227-1048(+)
MPDERARLLLDVSTVHAVCVHAQQLVRLGHPCQIQLLHQLLPRRLAPPVEASVLGSDTQIRPVLLPDILGKPLLDEALLLRTEQENRVALVLSEGLDRFDEVLVWPAWGGSAGPIAAGIDHEVSNKRVRGICAAIIEENHSPAAAPVLLHHLRDVEMRVHAVCLEPQEPAVGPQPKSRGLGSIVVLAGSPDISQNAFGPLVNVIVGHELVEPLEALLAVDRGELEGLLHGVDDAVHVPRIDGEGPGQHPAAAKELRDAEGSHLVLGTHDKLEG